MTTSARTSTLKAFFSPRMLVVFLMGVSSGLPLLMTGSTLQAWMFDEKIDLTVVGFFSLVGWPYTVKFLWAPFMDRFTLPFLDRRRGWILISQIALIISILTLAFSPPSESILRIAIIAFCITFFSASQDIVVDAYRREYLREEELGLGSSFYIFGYRIGMLLAGAFALWLADQVSWQIVYTTMAGFVGIGALITLFAPKTPQTEKSPQTLKEAFVEPFFDFFKRRGAFEVIAFFLLYKLGDNMATNMNTFFIRSLDFTKTDIGAIVKTFGMVATIGGGLVGGVLMMRWGMLKSLVIFGIFQALSPLPFSLLAVVGKSYPLLTAAITFEYLAIGMGSVAFSAFMLGLTNKRFTATQFALLTSLAGFPRVVATAPTGYMAKHLGWFWFFVFCALIAIPGLLLLTRYKRWQSTAD